MYRGISNKNKNSLEHFRRSETCFHFRKPDT